MYSICKLLLLSLSLSLFICLAHSKEVQYKMKGLYRNITLPIPISGRDYSLFHISNSLHFARISENNQNFITVNLSDSVDLF